ncbi:MAG: homoserine kinase [Undibacterium sp.]|nr:homoserine kinase [Opitutaceae bacterium]
MATLRETVTVRVPGSTSNCGAGFDTLGLALNVYNRVTLASDEGVTPIAQNAADARAQAMVSETAAVFFKKIGRAARGFSYHIEGDVPRARGLGSSVTVIAGVLAGLDALHGTGLSRHQLVELATQLEGHPDNASAGILGGFCVARCDPETGRYRDTIRFNVPDEIAFVVVSPCIELLTKESRGALPSVLPYFDAVRSINSAAYLVAAFASGDYARLREAGGDFMHEPYRLPKITGAAPAIAAGTAVGAYTGWLSGSGSSVLCVAPTAEAAQVGEAMAAAFAAVGIASEVRALSADNAGLNLE